MSDEPNGTLKAQALTQPVVAGAAQSAPHLTLAATYKDPHTGALWVHRDLELAQAPWDEEAHIPPTEASEKFGDVESWVAYVKRYGWQACVLLTWNCQGLRAILDYATAPDSPGRHKWLALHPFAFSHQWRAWTGLANGQAINQRQAVERLEDLSEDIKEPDSAALTGLLRSLRASVNAKADTELRADGTTSIAFTKDTNVKSATGGSLDLPPVITIAIPVLKGHVSPDGKPVLYKLQVRLRVSVDDAAHLSLRFSMPNAERILEDVFAERVKLAAELLGEGFELLRAAD